MTGPMHQQHYLFLCNLTSRS